MNYLYLHGFASAPQSRKAEDLRDRFSHLGYILHVPDLNQGNFIGLSLSRQIQQVATECLSDQRPITIIGPSFGGLTAAWLGEKYDCVKRVRSGSIL